MKSLDLINLSLVLFIAKSFLSPSLLVIISYWVATFGKSRSLSSRNDAIVLGIHMCVFEFPERTEKY